MTEDGPESLIQRWRDHAAQATLFARPEGSPLLEAEIAGVCLQLFERTNPYHAPPGPAEVLVDAAAHEAETTSADRPELRVPRRGAAAGVGRVTAREGDTVAVDVGATILLRLPPEVARDAAEGTWLRFEAGPPLHAFVLPRRASPPPLTGREVDEAV